MQVWDPKSGECVYSFRPNPAGQVRAEERRERGVKQHLQEIAVNCCCCIPKTDNLIVCDRSSTAYVVTMAGQVRFE